MELVLSLSSVLEWERMGPVARGCAFKFYNKIKHEVNTHPNSMEIKLQPEKKCDLPRLPSWLRTMSLILKAPGRGLGSGPGLGAIVRVRARAKKGTGFFRSEKPGQRCLGRDVKQSQGTFTKPLTVLSGWEDRVSGGLIAMAGPFFL